MVVRGYGKLNLIFAIKGLRGDGYHNVLSVYQSVSLFDELTIERISGQEIKLTCSDDGLPTDGRNLAHKAATVFFERIGKPFGVQIHIEKGIPYEAGLAGGSADAAAVLVGLNSLCGNPVSTAELLRLGAALGADVPFAILGGTRIGTGIGETLSESADLSAGYFAIAKPRFGNSTREMFSRFDRDPIILSPDVDRMIDRIQAGDLAAVGGLLENCFLPFTDHPEVIRSYLTRFEESGAVGAMMTGSGSTVYGLYLSEEEARNAEERFNDAQLFSICRPVPCGTEIIKD